MSIIEKVLLGSGYTVVMIKASKTLTYVALTLMLTASCRQSAGNQGGIVDNGNRPDNPSPTIDPTQERIPNSGTTTDPRPLPQATKQDSGKSFVAQSILGGKYAIGHIPAGLTLVNRANGSSDLVVASSEIIRLHLSIGNSNCENSEAKTLKNGALLSMCSQVGAFKHYVLKTTTGSYIQIQSALEAAEFDDVVQSIQVK
jgi:hypothetical protein